MSIRNAFGFWGASKIEKPVISPLTITSIGFDAFGVQSTLFYEGTETPLTGVGFLISLTNNDFQIGDPGVQDLPGTIPGSIPGDFAGTFTNLSQNSTYYARAYALNQAGATYTTVVEVTTDVDAFIFNLVQNSVAPQKGIVDITWNGLGELNVMEDGQIVETINSFNVGTSLTSKIIRPNFSSKKQFKLFCTNGGVMERFNYSNSGITVDDYPTANIIIEIISFSSTKWLSMKSAFKKVSAQGLFKYATNKPDLSQCNDMSEMFMYNNINEAPATNDMWSNGSNGGGGVQNQNDIAYWDVSNVTQFNKMFENRRSMARNFTFTLNWDCKNGNNFSRMFRRCEQAGMISINGDAFDLSNMTIASGSTLVSQNINCEAMFEKCYSYNGSNMFKWTNFNPNINVNFAFCFNELNQNGNSDSLDLDLDLSWGLVFSNNDMSVYNGTSAASMFKNCCNRGTLKIDFTNWTFGGFFSYQQMFESVVFDANQPHWVYMMKNKNLTHGGLTNNGISLYRMFANVRNLPSCDGWTLFDVTNISQMFTQIGAQGVPTPYAPIIDGHVGETDFSTWNFNWTFTNPFGVNTELDISQLFFSLGSYGNIAHRFKGLGSIVWPITKKQNPAVTDITNIHGNGVFAKLALGVSQGGHAAISFNTANNNDISQWVTEGFDDMKEMFEKVQSNQTSTSTDLSSLDLSGWNVSNVTNCQDFNVQGDLPANFYPNYTVCTP